MTTADQQRRIVISLWLTREEWMACWALQFTAMRTGAFGLEEMSDEEREANFGSFGRGLMWAIRRLSEAGYKFQAVEVDYRGVVRVLTPEPIEPRNEILLMKLKLEKFPSPIRCGRKLLELIDQHRLPLDPDPIHWVMEEAEADRAQAMAEAGPEDPEFEAEAQAAIDYFFESAGFEKVDRVFREDN